MPVGFSLDIWSLGCLFFELYTGDRLFKAKTDHDFLLMVEELLGPVNKSYIEKSSRFEELFEASSTEEVYHLKQKFADFPFKNTKEHFDKALMQAKKHAMSLLHPFKIRNFLEMESDFKEMLFSMLKWDASQRSSATDLLHHPFMEKMRLFLSDRSNHASAFKPYCSAIAISSAVQAAPQSFSLKTLIELKPTLEEKF
jgi:serine/threonine protein kinase